MFEDDLEEEFEDEFQDYLLCPSCGSNVAVLENDFRFGEIAHCKHDCGYKWYMLIEPDPLTFHDTHPYKKILHKLSKKDTTKDAILGHDAEIVAFEGNLEDIYEEDLDRYDRILKYSDFHDTLIDSHVSNEDNNIPFDLSKKRERFFMRHAQGLAKEQNSYHLSTIDKFLLGKEDLQNFIYVMAMVCKMDIHYPEIAILEADKLNSKIDKGVDELHTTPKPSAITYNQYKKHEFAVIVGPENVEKYIKNITHYLSENYGISLLFIDGKDDKDDGCRPLESWQIDTLDNNSEDLSLEELTIKRLKELEANGTDTGYANDTTKVIDDISKIQDANTTRKKLDKIVEFIQVDEQADLDIDKYFASENNKKSIKKVFETKTPDILFLDITDQGKEIVVDTTALSNHKEFEDFLKQKTTYMKTIEELFILIKEDEPIAMGSMKPFIITLEEFYKDLTYNMSIPSLIDYDNNIVFMSISHKAIIERLNILNLNAYTQNSHDCPDSYSAKKYFRLSKPTTEEDYNDFIQEEYQGDVEFFKECLEEDSELDNFIIMKNKNNLEYLNHIIKYDNFDKNWSIEEIQQWLDKANSKRMISYHEYQEYSKLEGDKLDIFFHGETNTVQVFTSLVDSEYPKMLTFRIENKDNIILMDKLKELDIKFDTLTSLKNKDFITLNGTGTIKGEIYFPQEDEEDIPQGRILVIPTASEEYFLPAISQMNGNGCIITEKGSKTSHLIINSKEFKFNIILVENAMNLFKNGDILEINFDRNEFN